MSQTSFYLHSMKNRRLYRQIQYPLTHFIDNQNIQQRHLQQSIYIQNFKYGIFLSIIFILISMILFQTHIYMYNLLFGPFHQNLDEFIEDINHYKNIKSWFWRKEYLQIELGENNIQNPSNKYNSIKKYSDRFTRLNHIATYKQVKKPHLYIKLPTKTQQNFHIHFSFDFSSFSIETLQCVRRNLQLNPQITNDLLIKKSEYVKYINEEYRKNATLFNMLVLTKCGILIGYLYRPVDDKAFIRNEEYRFYNDDIAFDTTSQYYSYFILYIFNLIFIWLFFESLFYLSIYLLNNIRLKLSIKYKFLSYSLYLSSDILEELWLLNIDNSLPYQQLLKLDEFIQETEYKLNNQLFVILFRIKLDKNIFIENDLSSFMVCPVTDIEKIVQSTGICYGEDLSWIPWPSTISQEQNSSEWLHEELMEISEDYQNQYTYRLQNETENIWNLHDIHLHTNTVHQQHEISNHEGNDQRQLEKFIHEEENFQRFRQERQYFNESTSTASPEFIANFRMEQKLNKNVVNSYMIKEYLKCTICYDEFKLNDSYRKWPCPSSVPHIFHYDCMLKILRRSNICPICRHPVESRYIIPQFFQNFIF